MQLFVRADRTLSLQAEPSETVLSLKQQLRERYGFSDAEQRLVYAGKQLQDGATLHACGLERDATVHLVLRLRGGKGGFGALLRAGARSTVSQNTDACRDLSGRRMRHVNADKKLEEWAAEAKERELEKVALQHIRAEAKAAERAARAEVDVDSVRSEQREGVARAQATMSEVVAALPRGIKRDVAARAASQESVKRARLYVDSVSDSDDSDAEELPASDAAAAPAVAATSVQPAGRSAGPAPARLGADTSVAAAPVGADRQASVTSPKPATSSAAPPAVREASAGSEASAATVSAAASPGQVDSSADVSAEAPAAAEAASEQQPAAPVEPAELDWAQYTDAAALETLGMNVLKARLQAAGLKCGGSLSERAARLFLLRDTPLAAIDRKHVAKPTKNK